MVLRTAVALTAVAALLATVPVPGAEAAAACKAKSGQFMRFPKDKLDLTLNLAKDANCDGAWEITRAPRKAIAALSGDYKYVDRVIHPFKVKSASTRAAEDPEYGAKSLFSRDVFPEYGDVPGNWLVQGGKDNQVTLEVGEVEQPHKITVYETFNAGGLKKVELLDAKEKGVTVFSRKDSEIDDGTVRCGDQVVVTAEKREAMLELEGTKTVRAGGEQFSEEPPKFIVVCPQHKGKNGRVVRFGDLVQITTQDGKYFWDDARDPNVPMKLTDDARDAGTKFTITNPKDDSSSGTLNRDAVFAIRSPWGRFLHVSDFTKGTLAFAARFPDEWSRFTARTHGSQAVEIDFEAPAAPWAAKYIRLTVDASKKWRGIDAVELTGRARVYPTIPGKIFSSKLHFKTTAKGASAPQCATIEYKGNAGEPGSFRLCWGCPKAANGKVCAGNGACQGGPADLGGSCKCKEGWGGPTCEKLLCPRGPKGLAGEGRLCSGNGKCTPGRCECSSGWVGEACEIRKGDHRGYPRTCSAVGDPHWGTFDGQRINVYRPHNGREVLYYASPQPFEHVKKSREAVVAYLQPYGRFAAVAKEVTIRSMDHYIRVTVNRELFYDCGGTNYYWSLGSRNFGDAFHVRRYNHYFVRITSRVTGMMVDIYQRGAHHWKYLDIHTHQYEPILPKITDVCRRRAKEGKKCIYDQQGHRGLCGNYDGNPRNDATPYETSRSGHCSWHSHLNCIWWNMPRRDVMKKVYMPSGVSFRTCKTKNFHNFNPTTMIDVSAGDGAEQITSVATAADGKATATATTLVARNGQDAGDGAADHNRAPCRVDRVKEFLANDCTPEGAKCARKQCDVDLFKKKGSPFQNLSEACDVKRNDGKNLSDLQEEVWQLYLDCIDDVCAKIKDGDKCEDVNEDKELEEFFADEQSDRDVAKNEVEEVKKVK